MKQIKLLVAGLFLFAWNALNAQDQHNKWLINVGTHAIDHKPIYRPLNEWLKLENIGSPKPFSMWEISYNFKKNISADAESNICYLNNLRWNFKAIFIKFGLGIRIYPFKEDYWFNPYFRIGVSYNKHNQRDISIIIKDRKQKSVEEIIYVNNRKHFLGPNLGMGLNIWVTNRIGLNLSVSYNIVVQARKDYLNYFQYAAGVVVRIPLKKKSNDPSSSVDSAINYTSSSVMNSDVDSKSPLVMNSDVDSKSPSVMNSDVDSKSPSVMNSDVDSKLAIEYNKKIARINDLIKNVFFYSNKDVMYPASSKYIKCIAKLLNQKEIAGSCFYIYSYSDDNKTIPIYKCKLSVRRANAIKNALIQNGVDADRLLVKCLIGDRNTIGYNCIRVCKKKDINIDEEVNDHKSETSNKVLKKGAFLNTPKNIKLKDQLKK